MCFSERNYFVCATTVFKGRVFVTGESGSVCTRFVIKLEFMPSNTLQNLWILCYN